MRRGRGGEQNAFAKLQEIDVVYVLMCDERGVSTMDISKRIGVSYFTVWAILVGRTWSQVTGRRYEPGYRRGKEGE